MSREEKIERYAKIWYWEDILKAQFSIMNLEFKEIVFIEEILPYVNYIGYVKVKENEFIEVSVTFNKKGHGTMNIRPTILNSIQDEIAGGKVLFSKLIDGLPCRSNQ
jgi:hypothetical protein